MKRLLLVCLLLSLGLSTRAQTSLYFPPLTGTTWTTVSPQSLGWRQTPLDSLLAFLGRRHSKSFIMLHGGRIAVEHYYGTFTQDSLWYWASAGKSLTATLVGLAKQDGILSLTDSTSKYLGRNWTSATASQEGRMQLLHQLTMTTGLNDNPPAPCDNESTAPGCLLYLAPPATRWAYHTGPYRLLQNVLASASGQTINVYTRQRLTNRLGMSGAWVNDVYVSRARDMARFGLFILARGSWNGTAILTDTAYFRQMTRPSQALNRSYGYLWWLNGQSSYRLPGLQLNFPGPLIPSAPADLIAALGKNDQKIYVVPSLNLVVIRQGNAADQSVLATSTFDNELWTRIMAVLGAPTATTSAAAPLKLAAFPNPATDALTVQVPAAGLGGNLRLLDALGRERLRQPIGHLRPEVQLTGLPAGVYSLQLHTPTGQVIGWQRVLKQ